ncbi:MAG: hypothetical protein QM786_06780 [Breznakibacter sp.]
MKYIKTLITAIILLNIHFHLYSQYKSRSMTHSFKYQLDNLLENKLKHTKTEDITCYLWKLINNEINYCNLPYIRDEKIYKLLIEGLDSANCFEVALFCYERLLDYGDPQTLRKSSEKIKEKVGISQFPKLSARLILTQEEKKELYNNNQITSFERALMGDQTSEKLIIEEYSNSEEYTKILCAKKLGQIASENCLKALCNSFGKKEIIGDYNLHYSYSYCSIYGLKYAFPNEHLFSCDLEKTLKEYLISLNAESGIYMFDSQKEIRGQNDYLKKARKWMKHNLIITIPAISDEAILMYIYVMETE